MPEPGTSLAARRWFSSDAPWLLALLAASVWQLFSTLGVSPNVWVDTLSEDAFVDECLLEGHCTVVGPGTTINVFHSAGYLHWRALLAWLGLGPAGAHGVLLAMNALGVVLVALVARWLGGRVAGAIAGVLMLASLGLAMETNVVSAVAPLPFLGAAFLLVAVSAYRRPALGMTALIGIVAGIVADTYATGLLCGLSSVWIALMLPERRWRHGLTAAVSFAFTALLIAPGTWVANVRVLRSHGLAGNAQAGMTAAHMLDVPMVRLTGLATILWLGALLLRAPWSSRLKVPAAVFIPLFAPMAIGAFGGWLSPMGKYGATAVSAACVGIAVSLAPLMNRMAPTLNTALTWAAPYLAAGAIAFGVVPMDWGVSAERDFTAHDVATVQHVLMEERGWDGRMVAEHLKTPDDTVRRFVLRARHGAEHSDPNVQDDVYLLKVTPSKIPSPFPAVLRPVSTTEEAITLLASTCSWIDWKSARACLNGGVPSDSCATWSPSISEEPTPPRQTLLPTGAINLPQRTLSLHLPLHVRPECPAQSVYMPQLARVCPGRIVSIDGQQAGIEADGRRARLPATAKELVLDFDLGAPECAYRGVPPFFLAGTPETVSVMASILEVKAL